PLILMGHSMGAATAALTAANYPHLVRAIILSDPPWFSNAYEAEYTAKSTADKVSPEVEQENSFFVWLRDLQAMSLAEVEAACRAENPHWQEAEFAPWAKSKQAFDLNFFAYQPDWAWRPWQKYAHQLTCPGLLLRADVAQGAIVTEEAAAEVLQAWAHGRVAYIPNAGHSIRRDQFEPFMTAVQAFLAEQKKGLGAAA
ncbi:MAG: alpha/beta hydrolase, partial [Anaerolineales bacterium]|nr:alpha/beta hydrolase [Anaerolineales bacterium]